MDLPKEGVRVGHAERESAIAALGAHLSAGRVTLEEYGTRSAEAAGATTVADLAALFEDLPAPHPVFDQPAVLVKPQETRPARRDRDDLPQRIGAGVVVASWLLWIPFLFIADGRFWWMVFLPLGVSAVAKHLWGPAGRHP